MQVDDDLDQPDRRGEKRRHVHRPAPQPFAQVVGTGVGQHQRRRVAETIERQRLHDAGKVQPEQDGVLVTEGGHVEQGRRVPIDGLQDHRPVVPRPASTEHDMSSSAVKETKVMVPAKLHAQDAS